MRKLQRSVFAAILSVCCWAGVSWGADAVKIGVVNFQKILETSAAGKDAKAEMNRAGQKMEAELKKKGADIEKMKKKLEREALVMSKEKREESEREMRIEVNDFKAMQKNYMKDFKIQEAKLVKGIQKDVFEVVQDIGKKDGYLMIVEKREGGVIYTQDKIDITDQVIQRYDAKYARKKK